MKEGESQRWIREKGKEEGRKDMCVMNGGKKEPRVDKEEGQGRWKNGK